ncbi:Ribosomal protein L6 family protein [Prunus dulcis]|uniref:60S ribosomal protein L6 n=1 Tax=Prunus dulcis TaxID=3755 RepID=A0A4Y1RMZ0_PRUDU|nr:Ribosomal protein L6 family protein [Prunus dulcis]
MVFTAPSTHHRLPVCTFFSLFASRRFQRESGGNGGKARLPRKTRNPDLIRGVGKFSRSKMYHKRGLWAIKAKNGGVFPRHDPKPTAETGPEKVPSSTLPMTSRSRSSRSASSSLPSSGTVFIILAGRFKGKRVVFLKQLPSGLLLVTGPFKINGVPLRRVNQSYVIATSTKVDISGGEEENKGEGEFFEAEKEEKNVFPQEKKDDQKSVDASLIKSIYAVPDLKTYLAARFSLKSDMKPHELLVKFELKTANTEIGCQDREHRFELKTANTEIGCR